MITLICFLSCVMINWSISLKTFKWFSLFWKFLLETLYSSQFCEFEHKLNLIHCFSTCIISFNLFMHHIVFVLYFFVLTCSLPLVLIVSFVSLYFVVCFLVLILAPCLGRLELIWFPLLLLCLLLGFSFLRTNVVEGF